MGLYGSKDQHPKLVGTSEGNEHLASPQWWHCEKCGHKHLKQYKKCPSCGQTHGKKPGWYRFWKVLAIVQLPLTLLMIWGIALAASQNLAEQLETQTPADKRDDYVSVFDTSIGTDTETQSADTKAKTEPAKSYEEIWAELRGPYIESCEPIDYRTMARNPDKYKGGYYSATGEVIQVMEIDGGVFIRMNVTQDDYGYWSDTIAATVEIPKGGDRILEDDIITIYGKCYGLYTYETVLGSEMSIPRIDAKYYDLLSE